MNDIVNGWEVVVGLEVHAQIMTKSKLFSRNPTMHPGFVISFGRLEMLDE
jgi:Glu-tRNA(Gln) amidotransferase subunit E-like FAD-binding protein